MSKKRKFRRSPDDEPVHIDITAIVIADTLNHLREENDIDGLARLVLNNKQTFIRLDVDMVSICPDNELGIWKFRLLTAQGHFAVIDRYFSHIGSVPFNWDIILKAMGWIQAVRIGAEQTIKLNTESGRNDDEDDEEKSLAA